jgi:hypothetical protein
MQATGSQHGRTSGLSGKSVPSASSAGSSGELVEGKMTDYALDNSWDRARRRLCLLEQYLDPMRHEPKEGVRIEALAKLVSRGLAADAGKFASECRQLPDPEITSPNSCHVLPSNFSICICLIGAKSLALVEIVMPGSSIGSLRPLRLAACFMMFSRVRLSPHALTTATMV